MKRLGIIINPIAGLGQGNRLLKHLVTGLKKSDIEPIIKTTTKAGDAREIAKTSKGFDALVCIGGDGTVNEVITGLKMADCKIPFGIIPVGSGNVIAKELKLNADVRKLIHLVKHKKTKLLDIGEIDFISGHSKHRRYFISMAGVGFDAEVTRQHHMKRNGADFFPHTTSYLPLSIKIALTYKLPMITVEVDGKVVTHDARFVQVANARRYGGPFIFAHKAKSDDGVLDIVWFKARVSRDILRYYWNALSSDVRKIPGVHHRHCKEMQLSSNESVPVQIDGDFCGHLPIKIKVIPSAISVFV
jgi:YegS/Rv2252/BmrU family lipid kinase